MESSDAINNFELKVEIVKYISPYAGAGVLLEKYFTSWLGKCD